jgi:hypothetical protein
MTRNRTLAALTITLGLAAAVALVGAGGAATHAAAPHPPAPALVTRYFKHGPSSSCRSDTCGVGARAVHFRVPPGPVSSRSVVTVSFDYRTSRHGRFDIDATVNPSRVASATGRARPASRRSVTPGFRRLAVQPTPQTMTMVFRTRHLTPGKRYTLDLGAHIIRGRPAHVTTSKMLVEIVSAST